jgi:hypothetical protein
VKRQHKRLAGFSLAALASVLTVSLEIWREYEKSWAEHTAADNQREFECAVKACKDSGGMWWRGDCRHFTRSNWRQPK